MSGGNAAAVVLGSLVQANNILGAGLTMLATYRAAREAWKAAHPGQESPFKEDAEIIALLGSDADKLVAEVDALLLKHGADQT